MEEVLRRFARLAGLTVEEAEQWQDLCGDAYVLAENHQSKKQKDAFFCVLENLRFVLSAAALAFYQYTITIKMQAGQADFTVGDGAPFLTTAKACGVGKRYLACRRAVLLLR